MKTAARPRGKIRFKEVQSFNQPWIWIVSIGIPAVSVIAIMTYIMNNAHSFHELFIAILFIIGIAIVVLLLLKALKFETVMSDEGIFYRWQPFTQNYSHILWEDVSSAKVNTWIQNSTTGTRYTKKHTHVVGGKYGLQLILKNGTLVFIGSQKPGVIQQTAEEFLGAKLETAH